MLSCSSSLLTIPEAEKVQNIQVFSSQNLDEKITTKSIEKAFDSVGLSVIANNNMNKKFKRVFGTLQYKRYNLLIFANNDLTLKLLKKYPSFGVHTPLTMSIWEDKDSSINISTLSIEGMASAINIPVEDTDLIAYVNLIKKALQIAMPNGSFKQLDYTPEEPKYSLQTNYIATIDLDGKSPEDFIEEFEAELEGELDPLDFSLPNYMNIQEEIFDDAGYTGVYDFYHTYSISKLDVIYSVSKKHPEIGAWTPCSLYLYKKVGENKLHIGFLSVENWIDSIDIEDEESLKPLYKAQAMIQTVISKLIE